MTPTLGTSRRRLVVLLLVCVAVALAGCSGWGTDGPADDPDASNASSDDLEDEQNNDSTNTADGSDATNGSDSPADGDESDDGPSDDGEDDSSDGDSTDDPSGTDESGNEDTSDESEDGSDESTDENTESESDGTDDESPSEQSPEEENGDENDGDENAADENDGDDPETYTLTVEAEGPVTIERLSDGATTTREATDGTVEFTVIEGDYEVRAEQEAYVDPMQSIGVTEDRTLTLQRDGSITYTVVDAETGEPIEGAEISGMCDLWYSSGDASISGESNANGVIEADTLIPTTCRYDTQITADGYEPTSLGEINVPEDDGTTVELQPAESNAALSLGGSNTLLSANTVS